MRIPSEINTRHPDSRTASDPAQRRPLLRALSSDEAVIPGEDAAAFEAYRQEHWAEYDPQTLDERELVEQIVLCRWQQRRLWRSQAAVYAAIEREHPPAPGDSPRFRAAACFLRDVASGNALNKHALHLARIAAMVLKNRQALALHQSQRRKGLDTSGRPGSSGGTGGGLRVPTSASAASASHGSTGASTDSPIPAIAATPQAEPSPAPVTAPPAQPTASAVPQPSTGASNHKPSSAAASPPPAPRPRTLEEIYPNPLDYQLALSNADRDRREQAQRAAHQATQQAARVAVSSGPPAPPR